MYKVSDPTSLSLFSPRSTNLGRTYQKINEGWSRVLEITDFNPRIHVVELAPLGFRYYRGAYRSFEEVPPRYTWKKVDYRADDTVVYVDLNRSDSDDRHLLH